MATEHWFCTCLLARHTLGVGVKAMRLSIIVSLGVMIVSFQNCSKASFSSSGGTLAKASDVLVPVDGDPDSAPPSPPKDNHGQSGNQNNQAGNHQCDHSDAEAGTDKEDANNKSDLVACILDGPGKSIKLGIMSNKLDGVNSVAKSVCVTEHACLDLVSTAFKVKGVEDRGYCKNNPNVVRLSDAEVKGLLGL